MKLKIALLVTFSYMQIGCTQLDYFSDSLQEVDNQLRQNTYEFIVNVPELSLQETRLLAHFLYSCAQGTYYEAAIRYAADSIYIKAAALQQNVSDTTLLFSNAAQIMALLESIKESLPKRKHALDNWQMILNEIEYNSELYMLNTVINDIHLMGKDFITHYLELNNQPIMNRITQTYESIDQECAKLLFCKGTLKAITEYQNPFATNNDNPIENLDTALSMAKQIFESIHEISLNTLKISTLPVHMLLTTALLFKNLYNELQVNNQLIIPAVEFFE